MKTTTCPNCQHSFSNKGGNAAKHIKACNGSYTPYKPQVQCPHCNENLPDRKKSANHIRWCKLNPKRNEYRISARNVSQLNTAEAIQKRKESIKKAHADGKYSHIDRSWWNGRTHSEEAKEKIKEKALASKHRRLLKSVREYIKKDGTVVKLDSLWEEILARRLDELNIVWTRPEPIQWQDHKGKIHNYFPDFYLPEYDLFLDPKNPYAVSAQKEKLSILTQQIKNLTIITTLEDCKSFNPLLIT